MCARHAPAGAPVQGPHGGDMIHSPSTPTGAQDVDGCRRHLVHLFRDFSGKILQGPWDAEALQVRAGLLSPPRSSRRHDGSLQQA